MFYQPVRDLKNHFRTVQHVGPESFFEIQLNQSQGQELKKHFTLVIITREFIEKKVHVQEEKKKCKELR